MRVRPGPQRPAAPLWAALAAALLPACRTHVAGGGDAGPPPATAGVTGPVRIMYPAAPGSFVDVSAEVAPSVVSIRTTAKVAGGPDALLPGRQDEPASGTGADVSSGGDGTALPDPDKQALGSGFVIDRDGYILTNHHIIRSAGELRVVLSDGSEHVATVAGDDAKLDVALLKIDASPSLHPARLGDSDEARLGEWVVAMGDPFANGVVITAGILSASDRTGRDALVGRRSWYRSFLQTDAAIGPANSGGPLVNTAGEVIGICTAVGERSTAVSHAVPINRAKEVVPTLKKYGVVTRSWLGLKVNPTMDAALARRVKLDPPRGAYVTEVLASGPAYKAGIRAGDVMLSYDGQPVTLQSLPWMVSSTGVGRRIPIELWRSGGRWAVELTSEKMPE